MAIRLTNMVGTGNITLRENVNYDFTLAHFVCDGAWHDLDLSGILPSWATKFWCRVRVQSSKADKVFCLRKKGNTSDSDEHYVTTQVAGQRVYADLGPIGTNDNKMYEYFLSNEQGFIWNIVSMVITAYD